MNTIKAINKMIATRLTEVVSSIWAFYAFFIFGLLPIFFPSYEIDILYWSNFLQLIFLPLITVGSRILDSDNDARLEDDRAQLLAQIKVLSDNQAKILQLLEQQK